MTKKTSRSELRSASRYALYNLRRARAEAEWNPRLAYFLDIAIRDVEYLRQELWSRREIVS